MENYKYDPRVENKGHELVYMLQTKLALKLPDECLWDVYSILREVGDYWRRQYINYFNQQYAYRYNEVRQWVKRNPNATAEQTLQIMAMLDSEIENPTNLRVRDFKF